MLGVCVPCGKPDGDDASRNNYGTTEPGRNARTQTPNNHAKVSHTKSPSELAVPDFPSPVDFGAAQFVRLANRLDSLDQTESRQAGDDWNCRDDGDSAQHCPASDCGKSGCDPRSGKT